MGESVDSEVDSRADHVIEAHEEGSPSETEEEGADKRTEEALDCLLGRQLDQRGAAKGLAADVCKDVVADDERCRDKEPDKTLEDVVDNKVAGNNDNQQRNVDPAEQGELLTKVLTLEVGHESDKANHVQHEADEAVVLGKGDKVGIDKDNVLEVVDDRLAVEVVVARHEEVPGVSVYRQGYLPVEGLAPVALFSTVVLSLAGSRVSEVKEVRDLLVDDSLANENEQNHVWVSHHEQALLLALQVKADSPMKPKIMIKVQTVRSMAFWFFFGAPIA